MDIRLAQLPVGRSVITAPHLCEPFLNARDTGRLLQDFGTMLSLMSQEMGSEPVLDFAAGSGWISEMVARMGLRVTALDIHQDLAGCIDGRVAADLRVDESLVSVATGDGHEMPFYDEAFGHILCYDSLHHMRDYDKALREFHRILKPGGRAIFVEPGSAHSKSPETIAFLKGKAHDASWIERDIVLEDIDAIASKAGFSRLRVVPMQNPAKLRVFSSTAWRRFRWGSLWSRMLFTTQMARTNYYARTIFYIDKPSR
jgi:SAM-dependent methyltransferase